MVTDLTELVAHFGFVTKQYWLHRKKNQFVKLFKQTFVTLRWILQGNMPQRETAGVIKINSVCVYIIHSDTLLCFTYRNERHKIAFEDVWAYMNRPVTKLLHKKRSKVAVKSPFWFSVSVPAAS